MTGPVRGRSPDQLGILLHPVRFRLLASLVVATAGAAAGILGLVVLGRALGDLPASEGLGWGIAAALLGILGRYLGRAGAIRLSHLAAYDLEADVRSTLLAHLGRVPLGTVEQRGVGPLAGVVHDDVRSIHAAAADVPPLLGIAMGGGITGILITFLLDWRLGLASIALAPLAWVAFTLSAREAPGTREAHAAASGELHAATIELVRAMPLLRLVGDHEHGSDRFAAAVRSLAEAMRGWSYTSLPASILTRLFVTPLPTLLIVLVVGLALLTTEQVDPTTLMIALVVGSVAVESVEPLLWLGEDLRRSRAGAAAIGEIMGLPQLSEPSNPQRPDRWDVRLDVVTYRYRADGPTALADVDLHIPQGTSCAIVGPSGAGKSTLVRMVARFADPERGTVAIGGIDARDISSADLLTAVAQVLQTPFAVADTVAENIRMARPDADDAEVRRAADAACCTPFVEELPDGFATLIGEGGHPLSGGQLQRLTIARALLADARVVLLDEATAFADPQTELEVHRGLRALCQGRTVLAVAHRLATVAAADRIAVMDRGGIVAVGTHEELLAAGGWYAATWATTSAAGEIT